MFWLHRKQSKASGRKISTSVKTPSSTTVPRMQNVSIYEALILVLARRDTLVSVLRNKEFLSCLTFVLVDLSENMLYPGRICSAEQVGCEKCTYHGTCYSRGSEEILCECFHWYAGEYCQINLKGK